MSTTVAGYEYTILHRHCACWSDGYVPDAVYADVQCSACDEPFGFGVPIVHDEGRLHMHLSCAVAAEVES